MNPGTSRHPHMSNRRYETLDPEYRVYFLICNVSWVLKRTVSTKRLFLCIPMHIFERLGLSVRLEENNNFLIQFYLQPNAFYLKLLKARCEMSETRAHFVLKEWIKFYRSSTASICCFIPEVVQLLDWPDDVT